MVSDIRAAIQQILDEAGDGWTLSHFVVVVGLERMSSSGVESTAWLYMPDGQPAYVTDGLLASAERMFEDADAD